MERKKRILIVDDDFEVQLPGMVETAWSVLGPKDWEVIPVDNVGAARKAIEESSGLDIVLIDLYLSDPPTRKEGLDLLKEVKKNFGDCYRILISSRVQDQANIETEPNLYNEFFPMTRQNGQNPYDRLAALLRRRTAVGMRAAAAFA